MCEFEDSQNCIWLATVQGNGKGESFIDILGYAMNLEMFIGVAIIVTMIAWIVWEAWKWR